MQKRIFEHLSPVDRIRTLEDNALDVVDEFVYQRELSEEELSDLREEFASIHLELKRLEEKKADAVAELNVKIKENKIKAAAHLQVIGNGRETLTGKVFFLQDFAEGKIKIYDSEGILVAEKPMRNADRQGGLFATGTE